MPIHLYAYELIKAFGNLCGRPHCTTNIAMWTDSRHFPKIRMERERESLARMNEMRGRKTLVRSAVIMGTKSLSPIVQMFN